MGTKGDRQTHASVVSAEKLQDTLLPLGDIRLRKMFGGHGVFIEDKMFALVDSKGFVFFKVNDTNKKMFEDVGSKKHGRMPYYQVPDNVLSDDETVQKWAQTSIMIAKNSKK